MIYSDLVCAQPMPLSNTQTPPILQSVANAEDADLVRAKGIALECVERLQPIRFMYDTPISSPTHDYPTSSSQKVKIEATADTILAFGMVEAKPVVNAAVL